MSDSEAAWVPLRLRRAQETARLLARLRDEARALAIADDHDNGRERASNSSKWHKCEGTEPGAVGMPFAPLPLPLPRSTVPTVPRPMSTAMDDSDKRRLPKADAWTQTEAEHGTQTSDESFAELARAAKAEALAAKASKPGPGPATSQTAKEVGPGKEAEAPQTLQRGCEHRVGGTKVVISPSGSVDVFVGDGDGGDGGDRGDETSPRRRPKHRAKPKARRGTVERLERDVFELHASLLSSGRLELQSSKST